MNKLILIFIIVALVAGAGGTYFMMANARKQSEPKKAPEIVSTLPLDERTINLADSSTSHYARMVLEMEVVGPKKLGGEKKKEGEGKGDGEDKYKARLMDKLIMTVSRERYSELITSEGKEALKEALKKSFNEVFKDDGFEVKEVLFTDFVME